MKPDPPIRRDGRCAVCEQSRLLPKGKAPRHKDPTWQKERQRDPFCSNKCARKWHGVDGGTGLAGGKAREAEAA